MALCFAEVHWRVEPPPYPAPVTPRPPRPEQRLERPAERQGRVLQRPAAALLAPLCLTSRLGRSIEPVDFNRRTPTRVTRTGGLTPRRSISSSLDPLSRGSSGTPLSARSNATPSGSRRSTLSSRCFKAMERHDATSNPPSSQSTKPPPSEDLGLQAFVLELSDSFCLEGVKLPTPLSPPESFSTWRRRRSSVAGSPSPEQNQERARHLLPEVWGPYGQNIIDQMLSRNLHRCQAEAAQAVAVEEGTAWEREVSRVYQKLDLVKKQLDTDKVNSQPTASVLPETHGERVDQHYSGYEHTLSNSDEPFSPGETDPVLS